MPEVHPKAFAGLFGQESVARFLCRCIESGHVSHAYLLLGKPGSGKTEAAISFARALLCDKGGCCSCDSCIRISRRSHPDVLCFSPGGVRGYLVEQVREILRMSTMAPVRAKTKVFILDRADMLQGAAANALLKTLEEPAEGVVFILLGRNRASILPTVLSRCQVVPFKTIPPEQACSLLMRESGFDEPQCRWALAACAYQVARAKNLLFSESERSLRTLVTDALGDILTSDGQTLLLCSERITKAVTEGTEGMRRDLESARRESKDFLGSRAMKDLEKAHSRELSAAQRRLFDEVFNIVDSWLSDCLAVLSGLGEDAIVNSDVRDAVFDVATASGIDAVLSACGAVGKARKLLAYNVTPRLVIDAMLIELKRGLIRTCSTQ